jgi:hypothetical protein
MYLNNTQKRTVAFPFKQREGEGAKNVALKTYIAYHVSPVSYKSYTQTTSQ